MRAVVRVLRHCEQATEHSRQRVIADAVRAYCEKFVAGWLRLQMLQVMSFEFAHVLQSVLPSPGQFLARTTALHCAHRDSFSSANSAFKEQNQTFCVQSFEEIVGATDAARAACACHRVAVCMPKGYCCCARNARSPMAWPNTPLVYLFPFIAGSIETFRGVRFLARKHCQRFAACFLRFL